MRIGFVSLFPEALRPLLGHSILGRAQASGRVRYVFANPREFCYDPHRKVDDRVFGGGPGMLMKAEPVALALESLRPVEGAAIVLTDPAGERFEQRTAEELARRPEVVFLCGHYEGIDVRVESLCTHFLSIGDFVLTGGELPSLVMADAIIRLIPGVLGSEESLRADSFAEGILSAPNYTRPEVWRGIPVPEVLRSGDHARVAAYRKEAGLARTRERRPDLLRPG
jgi:tRNA (guanine37-N1)-methyltransferase